MACSNTSYGYIAGGGGPSPVRSSTDRVDYSSDTSTAVAKGPLSEPRYGGAATGTTSYGYFAGGASPTSTIDRLDFSDDSTACVLKGPLTRTVGYFGAVGNQSYGYFVGGVYPGPVSSVDRLDYSNDSATTLLKGPLNNSVHSAKATGNANYGWVGGGPFYSGKTYVDRIDYSNDTPTASARGNLDAVFSAGGATGNTSYGYWGGGYEGTVVRSSKMSRVDFSNDTDTASPKGPLSNTLSDQTAFSSRADGLPTSNPASIMHDITGKGNDVTLVGATFSSDKGGYFVFDGTNDRADTSSDMFDPNADFTFSAWVNADVLTSTNIYTIISDYNNTGSFKLRYKNGSGMQIVDSDVTIVGTFSDSTISTSTWYNVTVTRSSNTYTLYLNGNSISTITSSNAYDHGAQTIGATHSGASQYWDGKISAIISYSKALTASEVQNNFNATRTRFGV